MPKANTFNENHVLSSVDGFYIFPLKLPNTFGSRYLYCKEDGNAGGNHKHRLFIANVSDCTEDQLREMFSPFGDIESIEFGRIAQGGARVAYISFTDRGALNKLFRTFKTSPESIHSPAMPSVPSVPSILEEYHSEVAKAYSKSRKEIRQSAEAALAHYEEEQNTMTTETDADGWTTVRRRRRADDDDMINAIQLREKRRREAMQKKDFYKFQGRENKRDQLREIREKFEKDRQRIEKMKQNRKFNPV